MRWVDKLALQSKKSEKEQKSYNRVPLPKELPGAVAVLNFNKSSIRCSQFELLVDDKDNSSFTLGGNSEEVCKKIALMNVPRRVAEDFVDIAREFGQATIRTQDHVVVPPKLRTMQGVLTFEGENNGRSYRSLPRL